MSNRKLLIIGSLPHYNQPATFGGATALVQNLVNFLDSNKSYKFKLIQANKFIKRGSYLTITNFFYVLLNVIIKLPFYDILMVNVSKNGAFIVAPILFLYSKILRKKFVFRIFGGDLIELLNTQNKILVRFFNYTVMKSDLFFVETLKIKSMLSTVNTNVAWFPNVRSKNEYCTSKSYSKKFIYLGHIQEEKGIEDLFQAAKFLSNDYSIDFYGNITEQKYKADEFWENENVTYKGVLNPDEVPEILSKYDVLILPSYKEGYPGVIIEAFSVGVPVIATNLQGIVEIVNDKLGFLIEPKNHIELKNAITSFNSNNYQDYSKNALLQFNKFNSEIVNKKILKDIYNLK